MQSSGQKSKRVPGGLTGWVLAITLWAGVGWARAAPPPAPGGCRKAVIVGELKAGQTFSKALGAGLTVFFQPIHSGWILRVVPVAGWDGKHDYAELATPPYQSVTPLSISTDFSFRAQDAVGWNPRRFRFATSRASYDRLLGMYEKLQHGAPGAGSGPAPMPAPALEAELTSELARTSEGTFTMQDASLVPGTADQWRMAGAVASHFSTTAHTLVAEPDAGTTPLGRLVQVRFRLEMELPAGFLADRALATVPQPCGKP